MPHIDSNLVISVISENEMFGFEEVIFSRDREHTVICSSNQVDLLTLRAATFERKFVKNLLNEEEFLQIMKLTNQKVQYRQDFKERILNQTDQVIEKLKSKQIDYDILNKIQEKQINTKQARNDRYQIEKLISVFTPHHDESQPSAITPSKTAANALQKQAVGGGSAQQPKLP